MINLRQNAQGLIVIAQYILL